jgi:MoaA/NifB/PqqE/SkfB family radical SAM enzyme
LRSASEEKLYQLSQHSTFDIKSTEAQHYRRFLLQRRTEARRASTGIVRMAHPFQSMIGVAEDGIGRAPKGINDGKGFAFISHTGEVYPSEFLPISAGSIRRQSLTDIYRASLVEA